MKAFHFPLDSALHWRRTQFELEQSRAQTIVGGIARIDELRTDLRNERSSAEREILRSDTVEARELAAIAAFQLGVKRREAVMSERRLGMERDLAAQRVKSIEAQRNVKIIENLRRKRLAEWSSDVSREQERFAAETHLGRWRRSN